MIPEHTDKKNKNLVTAQAPVELHATKICIYFAATFRAMFGMTGRSLSTPKHTGQNSPPQKGKISNDCPPGSTASVTTSRSPLSATCPCT